MSMENDCIAEYLSVKYRIMPSTYKIENRRYIGNKSKLNDWIMKTIQSVAPEAKTFCDIFSGTGTVANQALKYYDKVIINDLLYSNQIIYKAFFAEGVYLPPIS